jgi:hypothetical protein
MERRDIDLWLHQDVERVYRFRVGSGASESNLWRSFQDKYFSLLERASEEERQIRTVEGFEVSDMRGLVRSIVGGLAQQRVGDAVGAGTQAATGITALFSPAAGIVARVGAAGATGWLQGLAKNLIMRFQHPEIWRFLQASVYTRLPKT